MKNKINYIIDGKYTSTSDTVAAFHDKFWVRVYDNKTLLYTGRDYGGGSYYEVSKNIKKEVYKVIDENTLYYSVRPLVSLFKKNGAVRNA